MSVYEKMVFKCDRCQTEYEDYENEYQIRQDGNAIDCRIGEKSYDLCVDCLTEYQEWVEEWLSE